MREEIENWWKQAKRDLEAAKNSCKSGNYEWASFQSNQAAEKALKSLCLKVKKEIFHRHNLIALGKILGVSEDILHALRELNPDYTISRYPDAANGVPFEGYDEKKAERKIKCAEEVLRWIEKQLK